MFSVYYRVTIHDMLEEASKRVQCDVQCERAKNIYEHVAEEEDELLGGTCDEAGNEQDKPGNLVNMTH